MNIVNNEFIVFIIDHGNQGTDYISLCSYFSLLMN